VNAASAAEPVLNNIRETLSYFLQPVRFIRSYQVQNLRPDALAGLTVAIVLLPQAIAYALIAELPPQVGLYSAILAAIVGGLWGSSSHLHTGPTNATSLLVLATLLPLAQPGSPEFLIAAGLLAVLVGIFRLVMGVAHLGVLVNFVSDSVIIGFTTGAGVLIGINQLRHLLRLEFPSSPGLIDTLQSIFQNLPETHWLTLGIGLGVVALLVILQRVNPDLPGPLISMALATLVVFIFGLDEIGIKTIGQLPRELPPLTKLPLNLELIAQLSSGVLAVGAIGLVEAMSTARSVASFSGQRLDSNQEFVGQGLANIACGLFSGYTVSGSPSRSMVNYRSGAKTSLAGIFSGVFVLVSMFLLAPAAAYLPQAALSGVLIYTAYRMVDRQEIARIWRGARGDALILAITLFGTLFLPLQFAVLSGILSSFALYIIRTSVPRVIPVLPDDNFRHFLHQPEKPQCPQLAIIDILGDLYFGAVNHVEKTLLDRLEKNPDQRFLLLRMQNVLQCDISGIHALETILRAWRDHGGDVYMVRVHKPVLDRMKRTGFHRQLGEDHFLDEDSAIAHLFYRVLDPAICIYESEVRAFRECQNLPKRLLPEDSNIPLYTEIPHGQVNHIEPHRLWEELHGENPPLVIDVREPREFKQGHISQAKLIPLLDLLANHHKLPEERPVVFVCGGGRRSARATYLYQSKGYENLRVLRGGMSAWEAAGLFEAIE
jgi:sulfate permease, SulP family